MKSKKEKKTLLDLKKEIEEMNAEFMMAELEELSKDSCGSRKELEDLESERKEDKKQESQLQITQNVNELELFFKDMRLVTITIAEESIFALETRVDDIRNNFLKKWVMILLTYFDYEKVSDLVSKQQIEINTLLANRKMKIEVFMIYRLVLNFIETNTIQMFYAGGYKEKPSCSKSEKEIFESYFKKPIVDFTSLNGDYFLSSFFTKCFNSLFPNFHNII